MVRKSASLSIGLPHSGHSGGVSGRRVVEHGVEHVDERHLGDDAGEQFAGAVGDRAHQHAAGAAAMADDALGAGVFRRDQGARARPRNRRRCWSSSRACRRDTSPSPCRCRRGYARWHRRSRDRPATAGWRRTTPASPCRRSRSHTAAAARVPSRVRSCGAGSTPAPRRRHATVAMMRVVT